MDQQYYRSSLSTGAPLPLTPLIDTVFLIVVFFMVNATFAVHSTIPVQLPRAAADEAAGTAALAITVDAAGQIYLERDGAAAAVTLDGLRAAVGSLQAAGAVSRVVLHGDTGVTARSPCPLPAPPDPGRAKPSCGKPPRGGSETGTVPPPGAVGCGAPCRPSQSRHRAPAGAARRPQSRRHPASRVRSPPDSAVDGRPTDPRHAGARVPSACSRSSAARRSRPAPTAGPRARPPRPAPRAPAPPVAPAPAACAAPRHGAAAVAANTAVW